MNEAEAAVAILHARQPAESILLMRRAVREDDSWSGHWSFPGGRRDREDPDALHTALRELEEECGIRLARDRLRTTLGTVLARRKEGRYLLVAPFVFDVDAELPTTLDAREAAAACWVPLSLLRDPALHSLRPAPGRPREMLFPSVEVEGWPLWGFTYRLTTDWLGLSAAARQDLHAGFQAASTALEIVLAHGATLAQAWTPSAAGSTTVATVRGPLPVAAVLEAFSADGQYCAAVNCLEARPESIRLVGPAFEEYEIRRCE